MTNRQVVAAIFDFDGTLVDSDEALVAPFITLGVPREQISFGHAVAPECERLGISLDAYVDAYDTEVTRPFPGVLAMLGSIGRWAICSNKHPRSAQAEVTRLGWHPEVAMYADAFDWHHKSLGSVLTQMGLSAAQVVMVGDSNGDAECASEVGCEMVWAGWNPRVRDSDPSERLLEGIVLDEPGDLFALFPGLRLVG